MSLLKLAAFGAEILNMMDQNEDWDSDFTQRMGVLAEQMGLEGDSGEHFRATGSCQKEMLSLAAHVLQDEKRNTPLVLQYEPGGGGIYEDMVLTVSRVEGTGNTGLRVIIAGNAYEL